VGGYANDTWKVRPNFTINLGIRLEHETVPLGEHTQTLNAVANTPGVIIFQNPQAQRVNPMPRVGLAYSPGKSGKTSIRAGFGVSYDVLYDNQGILSLPPELSTTVDVTGQNQGGFLANGGIAPNASGVPLTLAQLKAGTGAYINNEVRPHARHRPPGAGSVEPPIHSYSLERPAGIFHRAQPGHAQFTHQQPYQPDQRV
jgi:outer membrane receptor protein involved in Fe transport